MKRVAILVAAAVAAVIGAFVSDARACTREEAREYVTACAAKQKLPAEQARDAVAVLDAMCDRGVYPYRAQNLVKKAIEEHAKELADLLAFAKKSELRGDELADAIARKMAGPQGGPDAGGVDS